MAEISAPERRPPITVADLEKVEVTFLLVEEGRYELYPGPLRNLDEFFEELFAGLKR